MHFHKSRSFPFKKKQAFALFFLAQIFLKPTQLYILKNVHENTFVSKSLLILIKRQICFRSQTYKNCTLISKLIQIVFIIMPFIFKRFYHLNHLANNILYRTHFALYICINTRRKNLILLICIIQIEIRSVIITVYTLFLCDLFGTFSEMVGENVIFLRFHSPVIGELNKILIV